MALRDVAAMNTIRLRLTSAVVLTSAIWATTPSAERMGYPPEEFAARRQRLASALKQGTLVMFGATASTTGVRFRQDNDFFYLTGNEALNAALVMDAASGAAHLFMPKLSATEIRYEGPNWLEEPDAARKYGYASIQPLSAMHEFLARRRGIPGAETLWTRLSERDTVNQGRVDIAISTARRHHERR